MSASGQCALLCSFSAVSIQVFVLLGISGTIMKSIAFWGMRDLPFQHVTVLKQPGGTVEHISSVNAAADFLLSNWPEDKGRKYKTAWQTCLDALNGTETTKHARSSFIAAAKEADIFVSERTPSATHPGSGAMEGSL